MPEVSVILPLFNGKKYIEESISSIQAQTFSDWEMLVINEFGSIDGSAEAVGDYAAKDPRIRLIQNEERLGLAESLNLGIRLAVGKYIARVDADDPSYPQRFEKQINYLETHPEVVLCGTLQRSVLPDKSYIQEAPTEPEELKAALMFGCEISHCSVMFRREVFQKKHLAYQAQRLGEDYDLWTRIMFDYKLVNLPEVLVDHRWGFDNISLEKGEALQQEVRQISARCLCRFGILVPDSDLILLSGWRSRPDKYARGHRAEFLQKQKSLLLSLYYANQKKRLIEPEALKKVIFRRWNWVCDCTGIFYQKLPFETFQKKAGVPKVSVVLPVYQAVDTLRETIDSILVQELTDWELLIINEAENQDGSKELAEMAAFFDGRIRIISNKKRLGLSESLNTGIRKASSEYIARIDADDLANPKRLNTQFRYLKIHPEVGICQTYQHYFGGIRNDFVHRPPTDANDMKAKLLFFCDACHSTVMFRKNLFLQYQLWYSDKAALEDYDLWTRVIKVTKFTTIPEVYGEYRVGKHNISLKKMSAIEKNMCEIIARQLKENLEITLRKEDYFLLNGWNNPFLSDGGSGRNEMLERLRQLLLEIWKQNQKINYYEKKSLLQAITAKWRWSKYNEPWQGKKTVSCIEETLELSLSGRKKLLVRCNRVTAAARQLPRRVLRRIYRKVKGKMAAKSIPYRKGEKLRLVFLFQIASFWPSWETFYQECIKDDRLEVKFLFLDETVTEDAQMRTAEDFLENSKIPYLRYEAFDLKRYRPHVMVIQTPYDEWHRKEAHRSGNYKALGIRLVYLPYGIEISDTNDSHRLHFQTAVIENCWRIYTFSERMKEDYQKYSSNAGAVKALGLPRFDTLFYRERFILREDIKRRCNGRKIVLWKVHFPKEIQEEGRLVCVTPSLSEYLNFAERISQYPDLFFIFMPHPRFYTNKLSTEKKRQIETLFFRLNSLENVFIDERDDYRESLVNADFIMIDRSAVMVEAGALGVPVLYLSNAEYYEPLTEAIRPLIESYYQGTTCSEMQSFIEMCRKGSDPEREKRKETFQQCIPFFDGNCGVRIKEDILRDIENNMF